MKEFNTKLAEIFGLSDYEAKLYLASIEIGQANLTELANRAEIPRTASYEPLKDLIKKGLISIIRVGRRNYYKAINPEALTSLIKRREIDLQDVIAEISKKINISQGGLQVNYFAGIRGIETAADIFLESTKNGMGKSFEDIGGAYRLHGNHQMNDFIKRRTEKGIKGRMIVSGKIDDPITREVLKQDKESLRKTVMVSPSAYPIEASFIVLDDMILIIDQKEEPFALLIKNKRIAKTLNSIHDLIWDRFNP